MDNPQEESSSTAAAKAASVGLDVHFDKDYGDKPRLVRRLSNWWQKDTDTGTLDLMSNCLCKSFESYYLV